GAIPSRSSSTADWSSRLVWGELVMRLVTLPRVVRRRGSFLRGAPLGGAATADDAPFLLGEPAPHPRVLVRVEGEIETFLGHGTFGAYRFGVGDRLQGNAGGANREEQVRIRVPAERMIAPRVGVLIGLDRVVVFGGDD